MSSHDPIADMLTQIRNGQMVGKTQVMMPASKQKAAILTVLRDEGYILGFESVQDELGHDKLVVMLKYHRNEPVIAMIKRVSSPGLRVYKKKTEMPRVLGGLGIAIVSTSKGVMSDKKARKLGQGGEVLCLVA